MNGLLMAITIVLMAYIIVGTYGECVLWAYYSGGNRFDGYMGRVTDGGKQHPSRSRMDCERDCTVQYSCMSNTFDPATKLCHLFNRTLTSTAGLQPTPGAVYHYKSRIVNGPFQCPSLGEYNEVNFGSGTCIQIRVVHDKRNNSEAAADCEATGGRLLVIDNDEKLDLFRHLVNCPDFGRIYMVDGSNQNAANYSAVNAYTTYYGKVIPLDDSLWMFDNSLILNYIPTIEHCLMIHWNARLDHIHYHTSSCSKFRKYLCEK